MSSPYKWRICAKVDLIEALRGVPAALILQVRVSDACKPYSDDGVIHINQFVTYRPMTLRAFGLMIGHGLLIVSRQRKLDKIA
ncbi:hypothetical protein [Nitrosomonas oligotropha]|uniref:Uncharacterized protein n=1 Tax=Nitrosomonas oligotropha TaxID=42354 RepID=A0A1H8VFA7_9PROT|nr:hypothetical protein [Nitrosomonas oligotropha]SDX59186.1 hypothetical protein SAMN05216300_1562 [Nitrosomonas oligotropha]SEP14071.1 hypothetical protein SAMN05216333_1551 [Nitrosomonas oligotropha]